jgi:hypothetical protein
MAHYVAAVYCGLVKAKAGVMGFIVAVPWTAVKWLLVHGEL